jgi:hypothetical protein
MSLIALAKDPKIHAKCLTFGAAASTLIVCSRRQKSLSRIQQIKDECAVVEPTVTDINADESVVSTVVKSNSEEVNVTDESDIPKSVTELILKRPIQPLELEIAKQFITHETNIFNNLNESQKEEHWTLVLDFIKDKKCMEMAMEKMQAISDGQIFATDFGDSLASSSDSSNKALNPFAMSKWDELRQRFKCCICLDVLAAPLVTSCTHNYCGYCLQECMAKCDATEAITYNCPECREPFDNTTYERTLDDEIRRQVDSIVSFTDEELKAKEDWEVRRTKFLSDYNKSQPTSKTKSSDLLDFNEKKYVIVSALAVFVLVLVYNYRLRKS